jgi:acyl transferase domain-containing protein/aryl carrier-like protein
MTSTPIAIIGIAAELPSGHHADHNLSHEEFHKFLIDGKDSYHKIPENRMNADAWAGRGMGRSITTTASMLKHIDQFDATEFGISSKDARAFSVSTRKLVELAFLALLDSGIDYRGRNIGCFASATNDDIEEFAEFADAENRGSLAGIPCMVANKISYHLDLRGPSFPTDTACSSSAVGLHIAVNSLRAGECDAAIVAGCQINLKASEFATYSGAGILAPDGKCKPFDAHADGFSRGEGAAALILKPLADAMRDGDHIYGTILGTAVNSCGSLAPVNAPVAEAQADAMFRAYKNTGKTPKDADYVEVHATGTAAGDPTEANWVGKYFGCKDEELVIGSVKGNVGHLEISSFLAQISKVLSLFETGELAPQANLFELNSGIHWEEYNMRVARTVEHVKARAASGKLLVSLCSSGIGGANAHAVMESYVAPPPPAPEELLYNEQNPSLLLVGGLTPRSAASAAEDIAAAIGTDDSSIDDIAVTLGRRIRSFTWRSFAIKKPGEAPAKFSNAILRGKQAPSVAFLFSGQGPQHINMGRQLFATYPAFRKSVLELDVVFKARTGKSIIDAFGLFADAPNAEALPEVWPIALILPSITLIQLALYDLFKSVGILPEVLIGHSAGETALLYASGAGSKEMALEIAIARGIAITIVEENGDGTMAAFSCSASDATDIINGVKEKLPNRTLEIACYNSETAVALAGHNDAIDAAVAAAKKLGIMARKIVTRAPIHSSLMDLCAKEFQESCEDVFRRYPGDHTPKIATLSTRTGQLLEKFTPEYFWLNSRSAVEFVKAMGTLKEKFPSTIFVEMSPHPVLSAYVAELGIPQGNIVGPMRRSKAYAPYQEQIGFLTAVGQVVSSGYNGLDYNKINGRPTNSPTPRPKLPAYPLARKAVEFMPELSRVVYRQFAPRNGPLNFPDLYCNSVTHPELADHLINSEPIMPAAGFIEMGLEFGAKSLWKIKFHGMLSLSAATPVKLEVAPDGKYYSVKSHPASDKNFNHRPEELRLHADGYFSSEEAPAYPDLDIAAAKERLGLVDTSDFYKKLEYFAQYGPSYRRLEQLWVGNGEMLARIKGKDANLKKDGRYILHPAILDACFHGCVHPGITRSTDPNVYYLPAYVDSVNTWLPEGSLNDEYIYAYAKFKSWGPAELCFDIALIAEDGKYRVALDGFHVARHLQVPKVLENRFEILQRSYTTAPYNFQAGSLLDSCVAALKHTVSTGNKKDLRILEIASRDPALITKEVQSVIGEWEGVNATFYVVSTDFSMVAGSAPKDYIPIKAVLNESDSLPGVDRRSLDIIIGPGDDSNNAKTLEGLREYLIPGGFFITRADTPDAFTPSLKTAGYASSSATDGLIQAQGPNIPSTLPSDRSYKKNWVSIPYEYGKEMGIQTELKKLAEDFPDPIWISTTKGMGGASLEGLGRTLQKEFPLWNLRLATFAENFSETDREYIISTYLANTGPESEYVINEDLSVTVPRVVQSAAPSTKTVYKGQKSVPLEVNEVLIDVAHTRSDNGFWVTVGTITDSRVADEPWLNGHSVVTVLPDAPNKLQRVPRSSVAFVSGDVDGQAVADSTASLLFASLTLGASTINKPSRFKSRAIVTNTDEHAGKTVAAFLQKLGIKHAALGSKVQAGDFRTLNVKEDDIVLTAIAEKDQLLTSYLHHGQIASWTSSNLISFLLKRQPSLVQETLETIYKQPFIGSVVSKSSAAPESPVNPSMFSADKSYILIGGMGSLGVYVAEWLYRNGARHIVLTSRSGRATIKKLANTLPAAVFEYLETLEDLNLVVAPVNGSDAEGLTSLVAGLARPLGGAILLAATWDDRLFIDQEQYAFDNSFSPKVGSLLALEKACDVNSLDWVVSMSSGTIFGNLGQTNYTAANTALDGLIKKYRNAFSIVAPLIHDTNITVNTSENSSVFSWADSPADICNYIADGLFKLNDGPLDQYVPPFDWNVVKENLGPSQMYDYMALNKNSIVADDEDPRAALQNLVLQFVDVSVEDFSVEVPLTAYGLDSISAGRLAFALRPLVTVSQMQLLADWSLLDLEARIAKAREAA